jgi:hypothetical protein
LDALVKETQWQKHSVRGFLAGTVRKKLKLPLLSENQNSTRRGDRLFGIAHFRNAAR